MNNLKTAIRSLFVLFLFLFAASAEAYALPEVSRIEGKDRYETSVEISKTGWADGSSQNVVIATGENFADALCAVPLAKKLDAPILLTGSKSIGKKVENELSRLGAKVAYIVGDVITVSADIEEQISSKGITCIRIAGEGKYGTSVEIAKQMGSFDEIVIASDASFPDVLSIAPVAAVKGMPIFLSPKNELPDSVYEFLKDKIIKKAYIIGGEGVISSAVQSQVPVSDVQRISGQDRYETNANIINEFISVLNFDTTYIATGINYPDALSGTSIASMTSSPIILTGNVPVGVTKNILSQRLKSINRLLILGGEGAVALSTIKSLTEIGQGEIYDDYSLRYSADFRVKVYDNVYWVPVNALGRPKLAKEQLFELGRNPEMLKSNINTLYDTVQYIRASDFKAAADDVLIEENGYNWIHHTPGNKVIANNDGFVAAIANLGNYMLKGNYEEEGFIHYFQKDGTEYVFNYVKYNGKYYAYDLTHYRNDFRFTAVESGNINDYYTSDYIAGNLHEAATLEDYTKYCVKKYNYPPELIVAYASDNVLPTAVKSEKGLTTVYFPQSAKDSIKVIHDIKDDGFGISFTEGPSLFPSWL